MNDKIKSLEEKINKMEKIQSKYDFDELRKINSKQNKIANLQQEREDHLKRLQEID